MSAGHVDVIVGVQWGDEGKGRVVDAMASDYDAVARFGGGDNAGHTLIVGDRKVALRIVPSGALNQRPKLFIGGGTVVSLETFVSELDALAAIGVDTSRIAVSDRAQLVLPQHTVLDGVLERARGSAALGTTGRGIGPAYADRALRIGVPFAALRDPVLLGDLIAENARLNEDRLRGASLDIQAIVRRSRELGERVRPHVVDGVSYLHDLLERGGRILAEGAQGTLLDLGYGTYPFVTSSHTIAGAACAGLGIGPRTIGRIIGVAKAYCTRVGAGPFPSELNDESGARLRQNGREFGTVTGRPRRCGWFDAVAARYASRLNGLTEIVITKLDILRGFERIGVVTDYLRAGRPADFAEHETVDVSLEWCEGWSEDITSIKALRALPPAAQRYVARMGVAFGVPVSAVSVGPERTALAAV